MHPAYSVIFFSVASGAGFGLVAVAALLSGLGAERLDPFFALTCWLVALALILGGTLSSLFHLGNKARAWRAFSQWRTSWLSREGVLSALTVLLATGFFLAWPFWPDRWVVLTLAALALVGAAGSVVATGMIYASLTPVPDWRQPLTVPGYLVLAAQSGMLAWIAVGLPFGVAVARDLILGGLLCLVGAGVKLTYWRAIDRRPALATAGDATGLGRFGAVTMLEAPHTETNYLQREMGFRVARKHATRLRVIALAMGFLLPAGLCAAGALTMPWLAIAALPVALLGLLVERWLFFAQARHTVTLYYGARAV